MNLDWKNLGFNISKTDYNIRCVYRDGKWGKLEVFSEDTFPSTLVPPACITARNPSKG